MEPSQTITLGIGNGSLAESVCWMLSQLGIHCNPSARTAWQNTGNDLVVKILISRPQHLVTALRERIVDSIIIGNDMLQEYQSSPDEFSVLQHLSLSKTARDHHTRVVVFVPADSPYHEVSDLNDCAILSEYPQLTKNWLASHNVTARITASVGSTESMIATGAYACGVGVTETGSSLQANNLRVLAEIMAAPVVMAVPTQAVNNACLCCFADMLLGSHAAQNYVLLKMNVARNNLAAIVGLLPSLKSPTIHELYDGESVAVETVVSANELAMLTVKLKLAGARDIIWHALDGVLN